MKNFHAGYKTWVLASYPQGIEEDDWAVITEEDGTHPFNTHPLSYPLQTEITEDNPTYSDPEYGSPNSEFVPLDSVNPEHYHF